MLSQPRCRRCCASRKPESCPFLARSLTVGGKCHASPIAFVCCHHRHRRGRAGHGRRDRSKLADRRRHRLSGRRDGDPPDPPRSAAGDSTLLARDFPPTLDPSSLRVEGESGARLVIGAVDARPPLPAPPANLPQIDRRIEALRDRARGARRRDRGRGGAPQVRRALRRDVAAGLGEKGEARPLSEWRAAFAAVAEEIATADNAIRDAKIKQRDIDREIARLEAERNTTPPQEARSPHRPERRCRGAGDAARHLCGARRALDAAL